MYRYLFFAAFVVLFAGGIQQAEAKAGYEKCYVQGSDGKSLIKTGAQDNEAGDEGDPWIWVPMGKCNQINRGDFTGVEDLKDKVNS